VDTAVIKLARADPIAAFAATLSRGVEELSASVFVEDTNLFSVSVRFLARSTKTSMVSWFILLSY
jgi:hypothetical protein